MHGLGRLVLEVKLLCGVSSSESWYGSSSGFAAPTSSLESLFITCFSTLLTVTIRLITLGGIHMKIHEARLSMQGHAPCATAGEK